MIGLVFLLFGCESKMDEHYKQPGWLAGNAYEVLKKRGNHERFLEAAERGGLKEVLEGKVLCTVFAPEDDKFMAYLQSKGYASVQEVPVVELQILVGYHIMQYSFKKGQLLDFPVDGPTAASSKGLIYKQKTFAKPPVYQRVNPVTGSGHQYNIYRRELFLPALSTVMFATKELSNYEYNYKYFFPNSRWYGDQEKVYVANAGILEYDIASSNGYVNIIDDVIYPLNTVYEVLEKHSNNFSTFRQIYDKFAVFDYDATYSGKFAAAGDSLFLFFHGPRKESVLPKIASEWTYNNELSQADYQFQAILTQRSFTAVVPNNAALAEYFAPSGFFGAYPNVDAIPLLTLHYFVRGQVFQGDLSLPEEFKSGKLSSVFGDRIDMDPDTDVSHKELCSNGTFYGTSKVITSAPFRSVTGPLFRYPEYTIFQHIMHQAGEIIQLVNMLTDYTLFAVPNSVFEEAGYRLDMGDPLLFGDEKLVRAAGDTDETVSMAWMQSLAACHIAASAIRPEDLSSEGGRKFVDAKQGYTYLIVEDDRLESMAGGPINIINHLGTMENGEVYALDGMLGSPNRVVYSELRNDSRFNQFYQLLREAKLVDETNLTMPFVAGERTIVMALSNDAVTAGKASGDIPTDPEELAEFLKYYFFTVEANVFSGYPLPGMKADLQVNTKQEEGVVDNSMIYKKLRIERKNDKQLTVRNPATSLTGSTTADFPVFAYDGLIYSIDTVLNPKTNP
jgi:uncharacterized surface protein with fasciclin (FAS1) repeats